MPGTYSVTFSFYTSDGPDDGANDVNLFRNNTKMMESLTPSETARSREEKVQGRPEFSNQLSISQKLLALR